MALRRGSGQAHSAGSGQVAAFVTQAAASRRLGVSVGTLRRAAKASALYVPACRGLLGAGLCGRRRWYHAEQLRLIEDVMLGRVALALAEARWAVFRRRRQESRPEPRRAPAGQGPRRALA